MHAHKVGDQLVAIYRRYGQPHDQRSRLFRNRLEAFEKERLSNKFQAVPYIYSWPRSSAWHYGSQTFILSSQSLKSIFTFTLYLSLDADINDSHEVRLKV
jgi:hypothetical protein